MKTKISIIALLILTGCSSAIKDVTKPVTISQKQVVETTITDNEKIFKDFAKMIEAYYGKDKIIIQSKLIKNDTENKTLLKDSSDMIKSAILKIGSPLVYAPYGQNYQKEDLRPKYVISGAITEFDEGVKKVDTSVIAGIKGLLKSIAGDFQGGKVNNSTITNMAVDLHLIDYESAKFTGAFSVKKISLFENKEINKAGFYLFGTGLEYQNVVTYKSAKHETIRKLLEIATLEMIAKELKLPYWKLINAKKDERLIETLRDNFAKSDKIRELQKILQRYGFSNVRINGKMDLATQRTLKRVALSLNIDNDLDEELLTSLWLNIPYQREFKYIPNSNFLHYPNDIVVIANQINKLKYKKVRINSIVDKWTRNRNKFSDEFKNKLVKYLVDNTNLVVIDSSKDTTRTISKRKKGIVDINGYFEMNRDKISIELKAIEGDKLVSSIKENFSINGVKSKKLSSASIAKYLKIKSEMQNDIIEVMSSKGELDTIYYDGERITFEIKLKKPMYLYIFNIDSKGHIENLTDKKTKYTPNKIYTIPNSNSEWEMIVEKPYGNEGIKFIALSQKIDFDKNIKANELVEYFRNEAKKRGIEIFEKSLLIETKEN